MTVLTVPFIAQQMLDAGISLQEARGMMERQMIEAALRRTKGNKCRAAKLLGIHRNNFDERLVRYEINFKAFRYPTRRTPGAATGQAAGS